MQSYKIDITCPYCGERSDAALMMIGDGENDDGRPAVGDWSLCWMCLKPAVYASGDTGLVMRTLTADEEVEAAQDANLRRLLAARQECYTAEQTADLLRGVE